MTLMALSVIPLHLLFQDDQNEIQHDFLSHNKCSGALDDTVGIMLTHTMSMDVCGANGIANSTIAFIRSR